MRVALICDLLGEENNGTVIAAMNLIKHLRSRGHTVYVYLLTRRRKVLRIITSFRLLISAPSTRLLRGTEWHWLSLIRKCSLK